MQLLNLARGFIAKHCDQVYHVPPIERIAGTTGFNPAWDVQILPCVTWMFVVHKGSQERARPLSSLDGPKDDEAFSLSS